MTRISTAGQNQFLLVDLLRTQESLLNTQKQITSGRKASDYKGMAPQISTLMGAKNVLARTEQFIQSNKELSRVLDIQNATMQGLVDISGDLRELVIGAIDTTSGLALRTGINDLFDTAVSLLNLQDSGRYVFGGTRTDTPPVATTTPAGLEALGLGNELNAFVNNSLKTQAKVDDNLTLTYGVLASDIAEDLFEVMQDLMIYESTNGFSNPLTEAQQSYLTSKIGGLGEAFDTLNSAQAKNGSIMMTLEEVQQRHVEDRTFLKSFVSDIEDADLAEAVTRLNQQQLALEASFQVYSTLNRLTLLDFI